MAAPAFACRTLFRSEVNGRVLAERYGDKPNIVWLNGGDTLGNENTETWQVLGRTIKAADPRHLMTIHPFGRTDSSWTFHREAWLDFNMFQSGHRRSEEHTSELQSLMRNSYDVFCLKKNKKVTNITSIRQS